MKQKKYVRFKGEKNMKKIIFVMVLGILLCKFVGNAQIQSKNSELQRLKSKIETQEKLNLSMQMKINELASLDNTMQVADAFGLEYNNSNIKVVSK